MTQIRDRPATRDHLHRYRISESLLVFERKWGSVIPKENNLSHLNSKKQNFVVLLKLKQWKASCSSYSFSACRPMSKTENLIQSDYTRIHTGQWEWKATDYLRLNCYKYNWFEVFPQRAAGSNLLIIAHFTWKRGSSNQRSGSQF